MKRLVVLLVVAAALLASGGGVARTRSATSRSTASAAIEVSGHRALRPLRARPGRDPDLPGRRSIDRARVRARRIAAQRAARPSTDGRQRSSPLRHALAHPLRRRRACTRRGSR